MAGILNYNKGLYSTQEYRDRLLGRNLPPPVNETLTESGLVSKLEDIGNIINVPINGTASENIQNIYDEENRMFPLGTFYRLTNNVNLNSYIPQNDEYITYELTIPPNLGYPLPEGFGQKEKSPYPFSYVPGKFSLLNTSGNYSVENPLDVVDGFKNLNFTNETSLGLLGGQRLEFNINEKISYVKVQANKETPSVGTVTIPIGEDNGVNNYINRLRGVGSYESILNNNDVGWNEYNESTKNSSESNIVNNIGGVVRTTSTESRVNSLLEKTSELQVSFLLELLNRNIYRPSYEDRRFQGTDNEGTNGRYYIGNKESTNRGLFVTKTFDEQDFEGTEGGGFAERVGTNLNTEIFGINLNEELYWGNSVPNFNEKTLLGKTKNLLDNYSNDVYINQTQKFFKDKKLNKLISRGNAIGVSSNPSISGNYARVWTVNDTYKYSNAIRKSGLFTSPEGTKGFSTTEKNKSSSVLLDNGFPKVHPTIADSDRETRKKFMFSIENLAWADSLADLPAFEIGPGDLLSGNKGRIMWFPPYGLTFDETSNANWQGTDFIGRGEPIYTYNNSSRSGSISFKILVDHPRVINCYRGFNDNVIERFNAGVITPDAFLQELKCSVPQTSLADIEKLLNRKKLKKSSNLLNKNTKLSVNDEDQYSLTQDVISGVEKYVKEIGTDQVILVTCTGYLDQTYVANGSLNNKKLSKNNADDVFRQIKALLIQLGVSEKNIKKKTIGKGVLGNQSRVSIDLNLNNDKQLDKLLDEQGKVNDEYVPEVVNLIENLIIDENQYFEFIDDNYPNYFETISEKIKYFHPGFHSITPEGLNSRLTFLNQCMRQGPSVNDSNDNIKPQNLSFGRPPVCILRIGDFFHTKIVINTLSISYDGPQFDFNPEGIGVQPMIASVTLSVNYVGGNSLLGPINKLQNAVSFNYYANTEIYDVRADRISNDGELIPGKKLGEIKDALLGDLFKEDVPDDQEKGNEDGSSDDESSTKSGIEISSENSGSVGSISSKIYINVEGGKKPSELIIKKEDKVGVSDPENKLSYIIETAGICCQTDLPYYDTEVLKEQEGIDQAENEYILVYGGDSKPYVDANEIYKLEKIIKEKRDEIKNLKPDLTNSELKQQAITGIKNAKEVIKTTKETLRKTKDRYKKIKVTAFFTKKKVKSKVVKIFTITENGLQ